jgi:hypothetical protein
MPEICSNVVSLPASRVERLAALRSVLAEKFPTAPIRANGIIATGIEALDCVEGGLRLSAMTEIAGKLLAQSASPCRIQRRPAQ